MEKVTIILALVLTIATIVFAIYTHKVSAKQFEEIADCTRSPLLGIEGVLDKIYQMFCGYENAVRGGGKPFDIWFLGFTLGLGYAHRVGSVIANWEDKGKHIDDFNAFVNKLTKLLDRCFNSAKNKAHCYCLNHDNGDIERFFIEPVYTTRFENKFDPLKANNVMELKKYHEELKTKIVAQAGTVTETDKVPLQVIVTTIEKHNGKIGRAVIVFNVGALNADTQEVAGFYSESEHMCEMFKDYIESLAK